MKRISKLLTLIVAAAIGEAMAADAPWAEDLWLGRGGIWTERVPVVFENHSDSDWAPLTGTVHFEKVPGDDFRVTNADGVELLWQYDSAKKELQLPVRCPAGASRTLYCYFNNPSAWGVPDRLEEPASNSAPVGVAQPVQRLQLTERAVSDEWPKGDWLWRLPLTLVNASDTDRSSCIISFPLFQVRRECVSPELLLVVGGEKRQVCVLGESCLFEASLPAKSLTRAYCYVREGKSASSKIKFAKASTMGNDFAFDDAEVAPEAAALYERLMTGKANLLRNSSFERINAGNARFPIKVWNPSGPMECCQSGAVEEGARFGGRAAFVEVPLGTKDGYRGWEQKVALDDSSCGYLYGGAVRGNSLEAPTGIDLHVRDARGKVLSYVGSPTKISGSNDWTLVFGSVPPMPEAREILVKLTTKKCGRAEWDGIMLARTYTALVGDRERAPSAYDEASFATAAVDPSVKVFRDTPVRAQGGYRLCLARGETESLQVAVRSRAALASLMPQVEEPVNAAGEQLPVKSWNVEEVMIDYPSGFHHFLGSPDQLKHPSGKANSDGWIGWWPDPMMPAAPRELPADSTCSYRFQVKAKTDAKAGEYRGAIVWKDGAKEIAREPFAVKVWNFAIPERPKFAAIYDLGHERVWQERGWKDRRLFNEFMFANYAEYKICPQHPYHYCAPVPDDNYDRECELFFNRWQFPIAYCAAQFTCLFCWGLAPKPFRGTPAYLDLKADRARLNPEYKRKFQAEFSAYWAHMKEKGWADKMVFYVADEPDYQQEHIIRQLSALCDLAHEVDPKIRIYSSTWFPQPRWESGQLNIWGAGNFGRFPEADMKRIRANGGSIWFTTDGQICIDTPYALTERALAWYSYFYGAEAYEFWRSTYITQDHWKCGWHRYGGHSGRPGEYYYQRFPNGDGYLFYPPKGDGKIREVMPSIRLEAVRDGVEDHAYLVLLEAASSGPDKPVAAKAKELLAKWRSLCPLENHGGRFTSRDFTDPMLPARLRLAAGELLNSQTKE